MTHVPLDSTKKIPDLIPCRQLWVNLCPPHSARVCLLDLRHIFRHNSWIAQSVVGVGQPMRSHHLSGAPCVSRCTSNRDPWRGQWVRCGPRLQLDAVPSNVPLSQGEVTCLTERGISTIPLKVGTKRAFILAIPNPDWRKCITIRQKIIT